MLTPKFLKKKCKPCEGNTAPLTEEKIKEYLSLLDNWIYNEEQAKIEKTYTLNDFNECIKLTIQIAKLAEEEGHHPDILIFNWNNLKISLTTHAIKGLSENDFIMAAKLDLLIKNFINKFKSK